MLKYIAGDIMITYYDLNELVKSGISNETYLNIIMHIKDITIPVKNSYPEYKNWFLYKHVPRLGIDRNILFAVYKMEIVGVINLKNTPEEKKICTLYVKPGFRFNRIGTNLLKMAFEQLGTSKPLITISDDKLYELKRFILNNNWEISEKLDNFYCYDHNEYVFNGTMYLPQENDETFKIYRKDKNNIFRIIVLHYFYQLKNLIPKTKKEI